MENINISTNYTSISIPLYSGISTGSTAIGTYIIRYEKKLESVNFIQNNESNFIEIIYTEVPTGPYYSNMSSLKNMIKEVYGVLNGKMQLIKTIRGHENPGQYIPPTIEWNE